MLKRADRVAQTVETLRGAVELLAAVLPNVDLSDYGPVFDWMAESLRTMDPDGDEAEEHLAALESELVQIEQELATVDLAVPMDNFRPLFLGAKIRPAAMVAYARLMGSRDLGSGTRRDRFEFVINQIMIHGQSTAPYRVVEKERLQQLLFQIAPDPVRVEERKLAQTLESFRQTEERLRAVETADELFQSGVYMDLRGYKLTLRNDLLNHDILYAVARCNVELANRIALFCARDPRLERQIRVQLAEQTAEVNRVFGTPAWEEEIESLVRQSQPAAARKEEKASARKPPAATKPEPKAKEEKRSEPPSMAAPTPSREITITWRGIIVVLVIAVVILGGSFVLVRRALNTDAGGSLVPLPAASVGEISEYLASAAVSHGEKTVFYGQVVPGYRDMSEADQQRVRDDVARGLAQAGYQEAFLLNENTVLLQVLDGKRRDFGSAVTSKIQNERGNRK